MNSREYFILGSKLLGVWCLFMSILHLGAAITTFADGPKMGEEFASLIFLTRFIMRLIPLVYILLGIYLLKSGTVIHNLAYPADGHAIHEMDLRGKFLLFLKLLGVYLIVSYFPDLLKSICSYLAYTNAPWAVDLFREKQFAYVNFLPSVAGILLGFYLLRSGQILVRLSFQPRDETEKNHVSKQKT